MLRHIFFFHGGMGGMCSPLSMWILTQYGTTAPLGLMTEHLPSSRHGIIGLSGKLATALAN